MSDSTSTIQIPSRFFLPRPAQPLKGDCPFPDEYEFSPSPRKQALPCTRDDQTSTVEIGKKHRIPPAFV
jgi:hypothetical protein